MKNVINRAIMAKKKMIFTLVLAIVSSVWMTNEAGNWCMPSVRTLTNPWIEVNGTFQAEGFPCEPDEECPPCLTIVLVTSDKTYYLVTDDGQLIDQLDTIPLGTKATVSGIPFEHGSYDYIQVSHIETDRTSQLPSLCDEWNVLHEPFECMGPYCYLETDIYRLTRDTGISIFIDMPVKYFKLEKNGQYIGALHEGNNRDIYYVPANSQNAYLLYAFNAQVGDELENVWLGGETEKEDCTNVHNATVIAISDSNPRIFTLEIIPFTSYEGMEVYPYWMEWIEGVGMSDGPVGAYDSNKLCPSAADLGVFTLLCAYKDGEQVYSSPKAQKYGCEFNGYYVEELPTDTIPLYARDDSGSSTVDPVDPNQIYATLTGDVLTVHNRTGAQVTFTLNNTSVNNIAARVRTNTEPVSFTESISVELTEDGLYEIWLTSEEWNYSVFGTINYVRSATTITKEDPASTTKKLLRGTHILIERGDKTYTLTGQEVK